MFLTWHINTKCLQAYSVILSFRFVNLHFLWPSSQCRGHTATGTRGLRSFRATGWKRRSRKGQREPPTDELIKYIIFIEFISRECKLINSELQRQYLKHLMRIFEIIFQFLWSALFKIWSLIISVSAVFTWGYRISQLQLVVENIDVYSS